LLHDLGKASVAFQSRLRSNSLGRNLYRHEWVSLRLFLAFVGGDDDQGWLRRLADPEDLDVAVPAALGARIADGVLAVKARDAEALNAAAADIEKLAKLLGVPDDDMARAKKVRAAANAGKWLEVFMELGFLQLKIMQNLESAGPRGDVLIIAGWMQGARYTTAVIIDNYSPENSNFLREPKLAEALMKVAEKLPAATKSSPIGTALLAGLPRMHKLIDIALTGSIPLEGVKEMHDYSTKVIQTIVAEGN